MKIAIRKARASDAPGVRHLLESLGYPSTLRQIQSRLRRFSKLADSTVLLATAQGQPAGLVSLNWFEVFHRDGRNCRMTAMIVDPAFRRKGVGKALVKAAEKTAKKLGCWRLEVTSGLKRRGAHRFYAGQGLKLSSKRFSKEF